MDRESFTEQLKIVHQMVEIALYGIESVQEPVDFGDYEMAVIWYELLAEEIKKLKEMIV